MKFGKKKMIALCVAVALALGIGGGAFMMTRPKTQPYYYIQDGTLHYADGKGTPWEMGQVVSDDASLKDLRQIENFVIPIGNSVLYPIQGSSADCYDLYLGDTGSRNGTLLIENVRSVQTLEKSTPVLMLTGGQNDLTIYNGKELVPVAQEIVKWGVVENDHTIYYLTKSGELAYYDWAENVHTHIDDSVKELEARKDGLFLRYRKSDQRNICLYFGGEVVSLPEEAEIIGEAGIDKFYYVVQTDPGVQLSTYIIDDMQELDARRSEPSRSSYQYEGWRCYLSIGYHTYYSSPQKMPNGSMTSETMSSANKFVPAKDCKSAILLNEGSISPMTYMKHVLARYATYIGVGEAPNPDLFGSDIDTEGDSWIVNYNGGDSYLFKLDAIKRFATYFKGLKGSGDWYGGNEIVKYDGVERYEMWITPHNTETYSKVGFNIRFYAEKVSDDCFDENGYNVAMEQYQGWKRAKVERDAILGQLTTPIGQTYSLYSYDTENGIQLVSDLVHSWKKKQDYIVIHPVSPAESQPQTTYLSSLFYDEEGNARNGESAFRKLISAWDGVDTDSSFTISTEEQGPAAANTPEPATEGVMEFALANEKTLRYQISEDHSQVGELYLVNGDDAVLLGTNVPAGAWASVDSRIVYYLGDYDTSTATGTLYRFNGKESEVIEANVSNLWTVTDAEVEES